MAMKCCNGGSTWEDFRYGSFPSSPQRLGQLPAASIHRSASLVPASIAGLRAEAQILTTQDLQRETTSYEAASLRAEQTPPLQAGQIWSHLGTLYQDAGRYTQAQSAYEHAMRLLTTAPASQGELATTIDNMGTLYMQTGNLKEAEEAELKALHLREVADLKSQLPQSWYHLDNLFLRERHPVKSEEFARRAVDAFSQDPNGTPEVKIGSTLVLAASLCQTHRYPEAIAQLQETRELTTKTYGANRYPTGLNLFLLGYAYWKSGDASRRARLWIADIRCSMERWDGIPCFSFS